MAWIRSQCRNYLIDVKYFSVGSRSLYATVTGDEDEIVIGEFEDKAFCAAELDAIERWIERGAPGVYQISKAT